MNSNYDINAFINYCDDIQVADEGLDTVMMNGFKKNMILYHGSDKKLFRIVPSSINVGNRLNPKTRGSSFWTDNFDYAVLWALDWVGIGLNNANFIHDIKRKKFIIPHFECQVPKYGDDVFTLKEVYLKYLSEHPMYVYRVNIESKYVSRGQCAIDEYTIDIPVKPNAMVEITDKIAENYIEMLEPKAYNRLYEKTDQFSKSDPSLIERIIFNTKNPDKIKDKRKKVIERYL